MFWVGFCGDSFSSVHTMCFLGRGKITPNLKCVSIMLRKYTDISSFRKYTFQYQDLLILLTSGFFFAESQRFFGKNSIFTQSSRMRALLELQTMRLESRFRITINQPSIEKMMMTSIYRYDVIVKTFWRCLVSVVMLSYWSKFHVNFITGSGVMTIFL